jgi:hypothetical protein
MMLENHSAEPLSATGGTSPPQSLDLCDALGNAYPLTPLPFLKPDRAPWGHFPDVVILSEEAPVKKHPNYSDAKAGDIDQAAPAAKRLAADFVTDVALAQVRQLISEATYLLPVHALEEAGHNRIPGAFAELLAEKLGLEVETSIVQANVVNNTGAAGWERLARPPLFAGGRGGWTKLRPR